MKIEAITPGEIPMRLKAPFEVIADRRQRVGRSYGNGNAFVQFRNHGHRLARYL